MKRQIVVTGIGAVTPLGVGALTLYDRWRAGVSGIENGEGVVTEFEPTEARPSRSVTRSGSAATTSSSAWRRSVAVEVAQAGSMFSAPFEALTIGLPFSTRGRTVTEADVVGFAALTGDWHPQHSDAEWAADGPFGERIAHGMLVMSLAVGLVPLDPDRVIALRRLSDVVFKRPVRFGDTVRVDGRITDLKPASDEAGLVTLAWSVLGQHGQAVCRAHVEVLWRSGPAVKPAADI
jgi:3-hydroxybutyryl-CoA dehydratase